MLFQLFLYVFSMVFPMIFHCFFSGRGPVIERRSITGIPVVILGITTGGQPSGGPGDHHWEPATGPSDRAPLDHWDPATGQPVRGQADGPATGPPGLPPYRHMTSDHF